MRTQLWIDGKWQNGSDGELISVADPSTGNEITKVASGTPKDAERAVSVASIAQTKWASETPRIRSEVLRACWQIMVDHADELASLIVQEHGKPFAEAKGEIAYASEFFRWNAEEAVRIHGTIGMVPSGLNRVIVRHPPVGVVVMITPWNFPAAMITRKLAPALAAGNAAVVKPAAETPLTALRIGELMGEAGVPKGLVNIVPTNNPGPWFDAAISHSATRMVSFTGSTDVGKLLLRKSADRVLKVGMELGGNAPFIVFDDADVDAAVIGAMVSKMRHTGETCVAANRFFVHESVAEEFTTKLAAAMSAVVVGNGFETGVGCGPLITSTAIEKTSTLVSLAVSEGARIVTGGRRLDREGYFYSPTVLDLVDPDSTLVSKEIFAPVAPIIQFNNTNTMLGWSNNTEMGLAAYIYSRDLSKALNVGERLQCGMVGINRGYMSDPASPFGGMKQSGIGREGASEGIYEFCETQFIAAEW